MSNAIRCANYRARNPAQAKANHARWREARRNWVNLKKAAPCKDCGGTFPPVCMDFDHLGDKSFEIAKHYARVGIKRLEQEIAKCDLVCANCHRIRTFSRLVPSFTN